MAPEKTVTVPLPGEQRGIWDNRVIVPSYRKAASVGAAPRQALPLAKCLGASHFPAASEKPFVSAAGQSSQGPVRCFPASWCPPPGPCEGGPCPVKGWVLPTPTPTAGTQSSDSLRGGGHGSFCPFNMGGLVWQERKLQTGDRSRGTGLCSSQDNGKWALGCQWPALPTPRWGALEKCFTPQLPLWD